MIRFQARVLRVLCVLCGCVSCSRPFINPWPRVSSPTKSPAQSHGSYWAGCLEGAVSMPPDGPGYQVMRLSRDRFWGHPALKEFILGFARTLDKRGLGPILVGDMGMPRGGPTLTGHASHQTGLDVDLWFWHPAEAEKRSLSLDEREVLDAPSMVLGNGLDLNRTLWSLDKAEVLRLAASFEAVERVFVNPVIKRELCETVRGDRGWLAKIRPWSGHDSHFHVRLKCPNIEGACVKQDPPTTEEGCGPELDEWFKAKPPEPPTTREMPELPPACDQVLLSR